MDEGNKKAKIVRLLRSENSAYSVCEGLGWLMVEAKCIEQMENLVCETNERMDGWMGRKDSWLAGE